MPVRLETTIEGLLLEPRETMSIEELLLERQYLWKLDRMLPRLPN